MTRQNKHLQARHDRQDDTDGQAAESTISFEEGLRQTQNIVRELESGELSLEASLEAYEKGVRLIRTCQAQLDDFERRIELLTGFDRDGNPVTEAFEESEMSLEQKQQARGSRRGAKAKPKTTDLDNESALF